MVPVNDKSGQDEGNGVVFVRVFDTETGAEVAFARREAIVKALDPEKFAQAWNQIQKAVSRVASEIAQLGPDEVELTFGVGFTAGWQAVLASASADVDFTVRLCWKK